jgi:hypothetical protein
VSDLFLSTAVFQKIVHKPKFLKIILRCSFYVVGKNLFQWYDAKRSWQLFLTSSMARSYDDKFHSRGIFILPYEASMEPWESISTAGHIQAISRLCGSIPVEYGVYDQVLNNKWLNDDAINAYTSLMENKEGVIVLKTYLWKQMSTEKNPQKIKPHVVTRSFIFSYAHPIF